LNNASDIELIKAKSRNLVYHNKVTGAISTICFIALAWINLDCLKITTVSKKLSTFLPLKSKLKDWLAITYATRSIILFVLDLI